AARQVLTIVNIKRRAADMRLLRPERSFKERSVRGNPERFPLRLHRGWRAIGNQDAQHEMPSPDFSLGLPRSGGNGQDRWIIERSGNLSNRSPSFARLPSCVRSRDLWTRPRALTEQVRLSTSRCILRFDCEGHPKSRGSTDQGRTTHENRQSVPDSNVGARSGGKASPHRPWNQGQE